MRPSPSKQSDVSLDGICRTVLEVSRQRAEALRRIKELLMAGDDTEALRSMREFVGLSPGRREIPQPPRKATR
jgi:hypothetical protein